MITTQSNREFIEEQYSDFILTTLEDGLLPTTFYRDVSDFQEGEVLNIKSLGEVALQEVEEDAPIKFSPIESGEVELRITEYVGHGFYITDKMKQDGSQIDQLVAQSAQNATRKIQEYFETRALSTLGNAFAFGSPHNVNGFPHLIIASGANNTITLGDLIKARLSMNKAEVPYARRVVFVDPIVEATILSTFQVTASTTDANPVWEEITEMGMAREHAFVINLFGFEIMTTNYLPKAPAGTATDGTDTVADEAVACVIMSLADDNTKPLMGCWRQAPRAESDRNMKMQRDEYLTTARFGFGLQREDSLIVIWTSAVNYA